MLIVLFCVLAAPVWIASAYLLMLTLLSGRLPVPQAAAPTLRFLVVVPAHDESAGIARTVTSLRALDWPASGLRVQVVADNCSDDTAAQARAAGAEVLERYDDTRRGKGYALKLAYDRALSEAWADAVVVVDADTDTDAGLLRAFASRLERGALAVQAHYCVRNPLVSWRTRLVTIALALFHRLRGRGRERLRLSCGLRGNGMCFSRQALHRVPHRAFSLVEDLEYGIALGQAGIRVWYADEVDVCADMVASAAAATTQRQRWEGGRMRLACDQGLRLLMRALRERSALLLDLALDLLVPPLGYLVLAALLLAATAGFGVQTGWFSPVVAWATLTPLAVLALHVGRGVSLSGLGPSGWLVLAAAPFYVAWKLSLVLRRASPGWVRTARERPPEI